MLFILVKVGLHYSTRPNVKAVHNGNLVSIEVRIKMTCASLSEHSTMVAGLLGHMCCLIWFYCNEFALVLRVKSGASRILWRCIVVSPVHWS